MNSQSNSNDENDNKEGDDREWKLNKRREQKAKSARKSYWNKKRKVDMVETSYCRNSLEIEMVETKKYAGYLIREDDKCMRFPDGLQYRLR